MAADKPRVLLTGAGGAVGTALWSAWEQEDRFDLTLTDRKPIEGASSTSIVGDICDYDFIQKVVENQDILVDLVYLPQDNVGERPETLTDIGMHMLLFESAVRAGVEKIVYASSNHASGWNERQDPPGKHVPEHIRPDGWYGAMKAMAEVAGRWLVNGHDVHFTSIRIGSFGAGVSVPSSLRACSYQLSPRDAAQLFGLAAEYDGPEKFLITYGASDNVYGGHEGLLDLTSAKEVLGYKPHDNIMQYRDHFVD
jgi:hypothetical protein